MPMKNEPLSIRTSNLEPRTSIPIRARTLFLSAIFFLAFPSAAQAPPPVRLQKPRLIVVISIDQFRYEYLERFAPWFSERGFKRFLDSGADFTNCNYLHATTFTGPGHASIGTGHTPSESGIIANTWFERDAPYDAKMWEWFFDDSPGYKPAVSGTPAPPPALMPGAKPWWQAGGGSPRYCAFDERVKVTAGNTAGMSPLLLDSDSLGDRVKERYPNAHVIGVALKDRAAILMAGRKADAAYWFDNKLPGFISSTAYRYDPSLFAFNERTMSYVPSSKQWTLSSTIPEADLKRITFDPPEAWKLKTPRYETHFPHPINDARALTYTPFANDMLLDFATTIVDREKLGADDDPDVLYVGVSTPDYIGHYYGPDSMEVADDAVRLDRSIARFINGLEKKVGASRLVVAITADHGVQSTPEIAQLRDPKLDAGRTDLRNARRDAVSISELPPLRIELERRLAEKLNIPFSPGEPLTDGLIYFFEEPAIYLDWPRIRALKLDGEVVKRTIRDTIISMRDAGFDRAFTNSELIAPNPNADPIERAVRASFRADRSGDVLITLKPNWIWKYSNTDTTHGQPLPDDRHVPLLLWGASIVPSRYTDEVAPTDLARTLGAVVGVEAGGLYARVLPCLRGSAPEMKAILETILPRIENGKPVTLIAPAPLVDVASGVRKTIEIDNAGEIAKSLPAGYGRLDYIRIDGDKARARIWTGPVPRTPPGMVSLSCGQGWTFILQKNADGRWIITGAGAIEC
jgi:predicted AlkP superfamily pyrophosphatase or phosphodiesterase